MEEANKDVNLKLNTLYQEIGKLENEKTSIENKFKVGITTTYKTKSQRRRYLKTA